MPRQKARPAVASQVLRQRMAASMGPHCRRRSVRARFTANRSRTGGTECLRAGVRRAWQHVLVSITGNNVGWRASPRLPKEHTPNPNVGIPVNDDGTAPPTNHKLPRHNTGGRSVSHDVWQRCPGQVDSAARRNKAWRGGGLLKGGGAGYRP
ncbi:hypothetical protein MTO96_007773 [Rhipicephalus appendiculatus]